MTEVIITNRTTINAEGTHNKSNHKETVCLTTFEVFVSSKDAAKKYGLSESEVSRCCKGIRPSTKGYKFCFLKDIAQHLDEIFELNRETIEKAAAYDAIKAEERAAKEAEERHAAEVAEAERRFEKANAEYDKLATRLIEAQRKQEETYAALLTLRETGVQYAM